MKTEFIFEGFVRTAEFVKTKKEKKPFGYYQEGKQKRKPDYSQQRNRKRNYE